MTRVSASARPIRCSSVPIAAGARRARCRDRRPRRTRASRSPCQSRRAPPSVLASDASEQDKLAAIALRSCVTSGNRDAAERAAGRRRRQTRSGAVKAAATAASPASVRHAGFPGMPAQNVWYGISLGSVLLLAAIGLAITFGTMGVINMAHGEMVMLGAYTTFVVQDIIRDLGTASVRRLAGDRPAARLRRRGRRRHRHRTRHHPVPLRPAARHAARDLGPVAGAAAGRALDLRPVQPRGRRAVLHVGRLPGRADHRHLRTACGSWCSRCWCSSP